MSLSVVHLNLEPYSGCSSFTTNHGNPSSYNHHVSEPGAVWQTHWTNGVRGQHTAQPATTTATTADLRPSRSTSHSPHPSPPPTQSTPSAVGWTPTHPPPGSFGTPTFPPTPPSAGPSTPSIFQPPSQGAYTPPAPHRPTPPRQTTTPQSLGFHEDVEHWDAKAKYGLKLLKRVASTPYSQKGRHCRMPH